MMRRSHQGSVLALVMLGLAAVAVLATIAYASYYQIARGTQDTVTRAHSSALLTQAAYTLATKAATVGDIEPDGITEPVAGTTPLSDGFNVPATSGAPKVDAWNTAILYCPWDNGSTNASTGRLTGINPGNQNSLQFALISAGPDKLFDTTCAQVLAQALNPSLKVPNGDDGLRTITIAQIKQGVGGTYFYGDPVANLAALTALPTAGVPPGMMRVTLDTQIPYVWNGASWLPMNAGAWLIITPTADCSVYLAGTLARDVLDDLYLCKCATKIWKKAHDPCLPSP